MNTDDVTEVFLRPGEWYFGGGNTRVRTLLGSCVSISLWHPRLLIGGMCHYLLAQRRERVDESLCGRYADEALLLLVREALRSGRPLKEFRAKLIGGASVLAAQEINVPVHDVPARNIDMARCLVRQFGLQVVAEDMGGSCARLVVFDIPSGDVWVRQSAEKIPEAAVKPTRKRVTT